MLGLPTTATAPFCPSEVHGSIDLREGAPHSNLLLPDSVQSRNRSSARR